MKIRVVAFATVGELLGGSPLELELDDGSRLTDLERELRARFPPLEALWSRLAIAVDGELSTTDRALAEGSEVALLPPVSGGSGARARRAGGRR